MEDRLNLFWVAHVTGLAHSEGGRKKLADATHLQRWFSLRFFPTDSLYSIEIADAHFTFPGGSYFCIPPDTPYSPRAKKVHPYYDIIFFPTDPFLQENLRKIHAPLKVEGTAKAMMEYIIRNWYLQEPDIQNNCKSFLTALLLLLFADQSNPEPLSSQFILTDHYNKAALITLNYIERNYYTHFSLDDLAKATCYNKSYLCTNFSANTGISIVDYANFLRVRKAIGSFLHFPVQVSGVAAGLGFNNLNYFSRTFKAFVGISPRDFHSAAHRISAEERAALCESEPLLQYQRRTIQEELDSMRHIGELFAARLQEHQLQSVAPLPDGEDKTQTAP